MAHVPSLAILLILSWKWYLFGACLWGLYLWDHRTVQFASDAGELNVRRTSLGISRLGAVLVLFAFLISPPTQWIFVVGAFVATAALGLILGYSQAAQLGAQLREHTSSPPSFREARWSKFGWMLFTALTALTFVAVAARLGARAQFFLLVSWGGGAGFLVGFGMCLWLWLRHREPRNGPAR
jgi:hypothetical protein